MRRAGHQQWEEGAGRGTGCGRAGYACRRERAQLLEGSSCLAVLQDVFGRMGESLIACLPSDILGSFHSFSHVFADIFSARSHCTSTNTKKLDQLRNGAGDGSTSSVLNTLQIFILREIKTLQRSLKGMYTAHWSVSWLLQYWFSSLLVVWESSSYDSGPWAPASVRENQEKLLAPVF